METEPWTEIGRKEKGRKREEMRANDVGREEGRERG